MRFAWLHDPEYRKDVLIVLGLFAIGLGFVAACGLIAVWLLQLLGWWDVPVAG